MLKKTPSIYRRTSNALDVTAHKLASNAIEVLQSGGMSVTEKEEEAFEVISSVLLDRRNKKHVLGIPAPTGFGKTLLMLEYAKLIAQTRSDAVVIVLPYIDSVTEFYEAIEMVAPGSAIAIRNVEMAKNALAYEEQFDSAATAPVVLMTSQMFSNLLENKRYETHINRYRGIAPEVDKIRHVIVDETVDLLRVNRVSESQISELLRSLHSAVYHERQRKTSSYATKTFDAFSGKVQQLLARMDGVQRQIGVIERIEAIDPSYTVAKNIVDTVRTRFGQEHEATLHAIEHMLRTGCRVEFGGRKDEDGDFLLDKRNDHQYEHVLISHESLADSLAGMMLTIFDSTGVVDFTYGLLPEIEFVELPQIFDFSNLTLVVCGSNTASRNWAMKPENVQKLRLFVTGELVENHEKILLTTFKGKAAEMLQDAIGELPQVSYMTNASGRGSNAYQDHDAIVHNGTAIGTAGIQISHGDQYHADVEGTYELTRNTGLAYGDSRVQSLVDNQIGVKTAQLIGRLRAGRRTDELTVYSLFLPEDAIELIKQVYPGINVRRETFLAGEFTDRIDGLETLLREYPDNIIRKKQIAESLDIRTSSLTTILKNNPSAKRAITSAGFEVLNGQAYKQKKRNE